MVVANPVLDGEVTADIYVAGSEHFAPSDIEWACEATFYPKRGRLESDALAGIYRIAYATKESVRNDAEHPLGLACGAMLARAALESISLRGPFRAVEGTAVGFDDGDLLFLGSFRDGRLQLNVTVG